jgi:MraZ protein
MEYGGIGKEVVLFAYGEQIELWAKDAYDAMLANEPEDFSAIADEVFGDGSKSSDNQLPL